MSFEVDDGVLRVSASYGLKVPGDVPYSSEDAHYSFSVELPLTGGDLDKDAIIEQAKELAEWLDAGVKVQAFTALDTAFTDKDGTLRPVVKVKDVPKSAPAAGGRPASGNTSRRSTNSDRKQITADFGLGEFTYLDNRDLKASGQFKPGAADFRSADKVQEGRYHSVWIRQKDGTPNDEVVNALGPEVLG